MLKKLIIVYNPHSSKHGAVETEVLAPARKLKGMLVGRYELAPVSLAENVTRLAKLLNDGDLVIATGGDGTASVAVNGVLDSGKDVAVAVMGYGNFNDMARMLKTKRAVKYGDEYVGGVSEIVKKFEDEKLTKIYPLEVKVDGEHWRYAVCYVTIGLFAESTLVFEEPKVRERLKTGKTGLVFSLWQLVKWYFKEHKRDFLPQGELNGQALEFQPRATTDYLAVNGPYVARLMRGGKWVFRKKVFRSGTARLGGFWRLLGFMLRSILWRVPGKQHEKDVLEFVAKSDITVQAEGEAEQLKDVKKVEIIKSKHALKVVKF